MICPLAHADWVQTDTAIYSASPNLRTMQINCEDTKYSILLNLREPMGPAYITDITFNVDGKRFIMKGIIGTNESIVQIPLPSMEAPIIKAMKAGNRVEITAKPFPAPVDIQQSWSLMGFTEAVNS